MIIVKAQMMLLELRPVLLSLFLLPGDWTVLEQVKGIFGCSLTILPVSNFKPQSGNEVVRRKRGNLEKIASEK